MKRRWPIRLPTFWQHSLTLASGSLVAQALGILTVLVLPRLYPDTAFGIYGVFFASVVIMGVVINGGYELAVMLPEDDRAAWHLVHLSLLVALLTSLVAELFVAWAGDPWLIRWGLPPLGPWRHLLPLSLLLEGMAQPLRVLLNRHRHYRSLSWAKALRALAWTTVAVGLGWQGWGFEGLVTGLVAGQALRLFTLIAACRPLYPASRLDFQALRQAGRSFADFPRYAILSAWLNTAARYLPFYLLIPLFDEGVAGQFTQADRVLSLPVELLAMSIGGVFYERATQAARGAPGELGRLTRQTFWQLAALALPGLLVVMIGGPTLFAWVLGPEWAPAGTYARWLMPWFFLVFMASPLAYLIDIRRKLRVFLFYNLALFLLRLAAIWGAGTWLGDPLRTVQVFSLVGVILTGGQLAYLLWLGEAWPLRATSAGGSTAR